MQILKALVIVMGVLIFAGFGVVVITIANRMSRGSESAGFGNASLALPAGCAIADARANGDRLILRVDGPRERNCQQVVIIDMETGQVTGRVSVEPAP